ncbi:hypothetical protein Pla123a_49030 [Posidoniimonas polymericola]|uniref:Ser-Thr-rich glycosyl-phosphatidyl-inositol-anchored membrane family protein n=1 Tax=Posidoniimonas polymericola TaxID=2528002 RepID=A0A5C5XTT4_9BACT|nr:hypothetical protein [Posidoniimonas polymericola]TWT65435.1 hypothetical protein Pla123a_49030 [Posidoniimonas polymericola]
MTRKTTPTRRGPILWRLLTLVAVLLAAPRPAAAQGAGETVVWGQDVFVIPYKWSGGSDRGSVREVVLYLSENHGGDWKEVTRARPDVQSFMYRAPADGEFWFAIRTIDNAGGKWPAGPMQPELRVVVDTQLPKVQITRATLTPEGGLSVEANAADPQLDPNGATISYQHPATGAWVDVPATVAPGFAGAATLRGNAVLPPGTRGVMVRVSVKDKAGNPANAGVMATAPYEAYRGAPAFAASTTIDGRGGWSSAPTAGGYSGAGPSMGAATNAPGLPADPFTSSTAFAPAPPPTEFGGPTAPPTQPAPAAQVWRPDNTPLPSVAASPLANAPPTQVSATPSTLPNTLPSNTGPPNTMHYASSTPPQQLPVAGGAPTGPPRLVVNSDRFELQYDLHSVGRWGVSKVEVWGTEDRGATWRRFAIDSDQRSPVDVQAPADGVYGFAIIVQSVGGLERQPPQAGDQPDVYVEVDRSRPTAAITSAVQPDGYFADHLNLAWQAGDANLAERPISLLYAAQPSGPWLPIASNLPNSGRYSWRLQRHLPDRLFVRIEARDTAGNIGVDQTPQPVEIRLSESSGRIHHARPLH